MIIVNVIPKKIELVDFNIKDNSAEFNLYFNDGLDRKVSLSRVLNDSEALSEQMVTEMRSLAKKNNMGLTGDWDEILVIRMDKEDESTRKLMGFFDRIRERMKDIKLTRSAAGFLDKVHKSKMLVVEL
jgi:DNA helicase IV